MPTCTCPTPVHEVAARFAERALRRGTSLLSARERLWSADGPAALSELLSDLHAGAGRPFAERWALLLDAAPQTAVRVAAEALLVHLLFPADVGPERKRALVRDTLALLDKPPELKPALRDALGAGCATTGVAYSRTRLSQIRFLVDSALAFRVEPASSRRALLADPWGMRSWLAARPSRGGGPQREALLHLLFPECFEPIVSVAAKERIVAALGRRAEVGMDDADRALAALRTRLTDRHGEGFSFVEPTLARRWQG